MSTVARFVFNLNFIRNSFAAIGVAFTAYKALRVAHTLYRQVRPGYNLYARYGQSDSGEKSYALVTGATDGIGRSFCEELARVGFNIVIVARNLEKAQALAQDLAARFSVKTRVVLADFALSHEDGFFDDLLQQTADLDIAVVVNSVGVVQYWGADNSLFSDAYLRDFVVTNCLPQTILSIRFAARMKRRAKRSAIVNLSSFAAEYPHGLYGATKAYNDCLSRAHSLEYGDKIDVMSVRPRFVRTKMTNYTTSFLSVSPQECVLACLRRLGHESYTNGHIKHGLSSYLHGLLPPDLAHMFRWRQAAAVAQAVQGNKFVAQNAAVGDSSAGSAALQTCAVQSVVLRSARAEEGIAFCRQVLGMSDAAPGSGEGAVTFAGTSLVLRFEKSGAKADLTRDQDDTVNPVRFIDVRVSQEQFAHAQKSGKHLLVSEVIEGGRTSLLFSAGGWRFKVTQDEVAPRVAAVAVYATHYYQEKYLWAQKLRVPVLNSSQVSFQLRTKGDFVLEITHHPRSNVLLAENSLDTARVSFVLAVPQLQALERTLAGAGIGAFTVALGKPSVLHLTDAQGYKIDFVEQE